VARNLILTGGHTHSFASATPALAALLADQGIASTIDDDIERGTRTLAAARPELLTVYALRWSMRDGDKYAPHRERWGFSLSPAARETIASHVAHGGAVLALHTAIICFDDWPGWGDILGAHWVWGRSSHPPYGAVDVRAAVPAHPLLHGLPGFTLHDEAYAGLAMRDDVKPLMHARAASGDWQPALWARLVGTSRVVVDTLGHDAAAFAHPVHRRIVARAAAWALGRDDEEVVAI
jgi:type 1 glutamine amidotransferase